MLRARRVSTGTFVTRCRVEMAAEQLKLRLLSSLFPSSVSSLYLGVVASPAVYDGAGLAGKLALLQVLQVGELTSHFFACGC